MVTMSTKSLAATGLHAAADTCSSRPVPQSRHAVMSLSESSASLFLVLLVVGDLAFIVLHFINAFTPSMRKPLLSLSVDRGYAEIYQYLKFLWIVIILIGISLRTASIQYVAWVLVFAYFLLDDAMLIHERVGDYVAATFSFTPSLGMRPKDFGELAVSAAAAFILLFPLMWAYRKGTGTFRKISQDLALLISVLVFFGVVVDMAHIAIELGATVKFSLGLIEDAGEMLSVSLILWYAFLLMTKESDRDFYLCDFVRIALRKS